MKKLISESGDGQPSNRVSFNSNLKSLTTKSLLPKRRVSSSKKERKVAAAIVLEAAVARLDAAKSAYQRNPRLAKQTFLLGLIRAGFFLVILGLGEIAQDPQLVKK